MYLKNKVKVINQNFFVFFCLYKINHPTLTQSKQPDEQALNSESYFFFYELQWRSHSRLLSLHENNMCGGRWTRNITLNTPSL